MDFVQLAKKRTSTKYFLPEVEITKAELKEIISLTNEAPSAFNLQHTQYIAVISREFKLQLLEAANGQQKVKDASAVIVVIGNKHAPILKTADKKGMDILGSPDESAYLEKIKYISDFYDARGQQFYHEEAIRNASLSAMMLMLSAENRGWNTCPMIGYNKEKVKQVLRISEELEPVMMIAIGKEDPASKKERAYRKPADELITFI